MKSTSIKEICNIISGNLLIGEENAVVSKVAQDSRLVESGCLFFAIKGDNADGHIYINQAIENGASFVIISDERAFVKEYFLEKNVGAILVENGEKALHRLAEWNLDQIGAKRIGVTGSVGKTTTRDLIYSVLSKKFKAHKNAGNYNSSIGAALTVLDMPEDTEVAVIEMGMDRFGEIDAISSYVKPDICVITNIGMSHMEILGSRENIFKAKMEIVNHSSEESYLICYEGDFLNKETIEKYLDENDITINHICIVGEDKNSDVRIDEFKALYASSTFTLMSEPESKAAPAKESYTINMRGKHNCKNAALAVEVAKLMGMSKADIDNAFNEIYLTGKRLEEKVVKGIRIIDDSYNASPDSMKAAIDVLNSIEGRKIAILGDMYELGISEKELHEEVGEYCHGKVDKLYTIGKLGRFISDKNHFDHKEEALETIKSVVEKDDVILVKASRGMKLDELVDQLVEYINNEDKI